MNKNNLCGKTNGDDLLKKALEHYEKLSNECHNWYNVIPKAIKFYYENKKFEFEKGYSVGLIMGIIMGIFTYLVINTML